MRGVSCEEEDGLAEVEEAGAGVAEQEGQLAAVVVGRLGVRVALAEGVDERQEVGYVPVEGLRSGLR